MTRKSGVGDGVEVSYLIGTFVSDHLVRAYRLFDGDLAAAVVLANVAQHNVQRYYDEIGSKAPEGFDALVEAGVHRGSLRHCNAHSLSEATGIPRETVRRKVRALEARGLLIVGERGELTVAPRVAKRFTEFDAETARRFEGCARSVLAVIDKRA
jgi:DNA-binding transcriptional ArsR family regulator